MNAGNRRNSSPVITLAVILLLPVIVFLSYFAISEPVKLHFLIRTIEKTDTPAEEHRAFELAAKWGRPWEIDLLNQNFKGSGQSLEGRRLVRIEWLESCFWNGRPNQCACLFLDEDVYYLSPCRNKIELQDRGA
jgi:hypothetical protein